MTPCELWTGSVKPNGYGQWPNRIGGTRLAHRITFFIAHGYMPEVVRHKCDVKLCVALDHLEAGTHQDNVNDRGDRGHTARGERVATCKLTDEQVALLRQETGKTQFQLAAEYGISRRQVQRILYGLSRSVGV